STVPLRGNQSCRDQPFRARDADPERRSVGRGREEQEARCHEGGARGEPGGGAEVKDAGREAGSPERDMKIHLDKNLEEERQLLLQQQKICRNRARKYFVESNRRKKAFEEKWKEQEEREHQIREQILQQRKQKFEEVTEKFQRAHIPLSQRRRAVFQKPVPPLEEALKQIQESTLKSEVNIPSSHRPTINWRSIPACPAVSTPDPYLPDQLSPSRAPLLFHHSQILPSYPTVSPTRQPNTLPICPSIPSTRPKTFLPAPVLSNPIKYLPHPPAPVTPSFSSSFPRLPAPILSRPPDHLPHPPQSSPIPDPNSQNKLFYKTFRPKYILPTQRSTPATLTPALVRRSLPARLVVSPTPLEALPVLKPSCLSSHPPHQSVPTLSYIAPLPEHFANLDPFQPVQQSFPQTTTLPSTCLSSLPSTSLSFSILFFVFLSFFHVIFSLYTVFFLFIQSFLSFTFPFCLSSLASTCPSVFLSIAFFSLSTFASNLFRFSLSNTSLFFFLYYFFFLSPHASVSLSFYLPIPFHPYPFLQSSSLGEESREEKRSKVINNTLPSSLLKSDHKHQKHHLSQINRDKELKENSRTELSMNKDVFQLKLEETQKLLEDQHLSSLQKFCDEVNQITNSETLSSIDSLEAGEHEKIYLTINKEPSTSTQQNSFKSANLQSTNLSCFDEDKLSFSKTQHINNWLVRLDDPKTQTLTAFSDILSKPSCERSNSKEQNSFAPSNTVEGAINTTNNSGASAYNLPIFVQGSNMEKTSENSTVRTTSFSSRALKRERPLVTESPIFKCSKAWTTPDSLPREVASFSDQETYPELTGEDGTASAPTSFVPAAALLVLPSNTQSARPLPKNRSHIKEIDPVQCSDRLKELKDVKDENIDYFSCNKEFSLFSDNFQATYIPHNSDLKEKQKISETSTLLSNCDLLGEHNKLEYNVHERNDVRFLKSILKKDSKYEHDCFKTLLINQGFKLGNQKAATIRDSIELTKEKGKVEEVPKTIKKLRWFDETGDTEKNAEENHSLKNRIGISQQWSQPFHIQSKGDVASYMISVPACAVNSADRKKPTEDFASENVSTLGESGTDPAPWNSFIPSGYNVAKQAWPASQKEESKAPSGDSKTQKTAQKCGAKIRRTRSAKVQPGFIYTNRKGTVIRPQSASKANTFLQAQGKIIVPHPPPKTPSNIRSAKKIQVSQCQPIKPEHSLNVITHDCFSSKHVHPTEPELNQCNQESYLPFSDVCSDLVTVMPSLPYRSSECQTLAKANHPNSTQMVALQDGTLYCTQRYPDYDKSHHPVILRPTKEPVTLWKRRHNALGQNEKTADSTLIRRKRIVENKQRSLLEKKRQNPGSVGQKYSEQMNNFGQTVRLSSSEPKQTTRGTSNIEEDSTSEFLVAENLVKASVPEDQILTVINSKQLQKPDMALNKTQQFTICALSDEEQKILQSLNRLNESLYCKYGRISFSEKCYILYLDYLNFNLKVKREGEREGKGEKEEGKKVDLAQVLNHVEDVLLGLEQKENAFLSSSSFHAARRESTRTPGVAAAAAKAAKAAVVAEVEACKPRESEDLQEARRPTSLLATPPPAMYLVASLQMM
ncbi:Centrosomal protein of 126 kDa, partial [Galemys pyrenaicus]